MKLNESLVKKHFYLWAQVVQLVFLRPTVGTGGSVSGLVLGKQEC